LGIIRTTLRKLLRVRGAPALLSLAAAAPLLMAQCAPSGPSPAVPGAPRYGNGTHIVNQGFVPGLYFSVGNSCYWERLSGLGGTLGEIIENDISSGQHVVYVPSTDVAFRSLNCGTWTWFNPPVFPRVISDGDWDVRTQMGANVWVAKPTGTCYWERARGYTHRNEVIANDFTNAKQLVVQVLASDVRFSTNGCGTWVPFNPPLQAIPISDGDWSVARQMGAGRWRANAPGECYWERARGYTHVPGEVIASGAVARGQVVVDVSPSDVRFTSSGCGGWTRIG
jgi:hypothetical protein